MSCTKAPVREAVSHKDTYQQAYVYGFPMIAAYKAMYQFNVDKANSQYKTGFNQIWNDSKVFTPKDTAIVTPNSDTPYSMLQVDLRAEPIVFCVPKVEKNRYYSVQLTDMDSFNYGYVGSRATGSDAGCYMIIGPDWKGETPKGIRHAFHSETQFGLVIYRTQLFSPADIGNVKKIQVATRPSLSPLSCINPRRPRLRRPTFPAFTEDAFKTDFPKYLNFLLQFCSAVSEETALRAKFAEVGIEVGKPFDLGKLSEAEKVEEGLGVKGGYDSIVKQKDNIGKTINGWSVGSAFGDRTFYHGDYLLRAAAALAGIYGNDAVEAMYPMAKSDATASRSTAASITTRLPSRLASILRQRVLVGDDVRRQNAVADREPDQPLSHQFADAARDEEKRRRVAHHLHPEGRSVGRQESQLAARAGWPDLHGDASLLAEGEAAFDPSAG